MIKTLFILLIVCAAVLFGGKYYVEHRYEKELDQAISLYGLPASYKDVKVGFDGSLALNGLTVTPPGKDQEIRYGTIKMSSSDRFMAIKGRKAFGPGKFPEAMSISGSMDFSTSLLAPGPAKQHCRGFDTTLMLYSEIGEERIRADIDMTFDFSDPYNAVMDVYYSDNIVTADIQWVLDVEGVQQAVMSGGEAPIREVSIKSELNSAAADSIAEYCANLFSLEKEAFLTKVVGSSKYSANSFGGDLGPQFREAFVKYMRGGVSVRIKSEPSKQLLNLSNAKFYKPRDVLRWLNLQVFVEGNLVPVTIVKQKAVEKAVTSEPARKLPTYETVKVSQVTRYVDSDVRISRTKGRKPIKGRLLSVKGGLLAVEIYRFSGQMTLKIPAGDISKLEVLSPDT